MTHTDDPFHALRQAETAFSDALADGTADEIRAARAALARVVENTPPAIRDAWQTQSTDTARAALQARDTDQAGGPFHVTPHHNGPSRLFSGFTVTLDDPTTADPAHLVSALVHRGHLAAVLDAMAVTMDPQPDEDRLRSRLISTTHLGGILRARSEWSALVARDRYGWSWRTLAGVLDVHHTTASRQVTAYRRTLAERGVWVDAAGVHTASTTPTPGLDEAGRALVARGLAHHREQHGGVWPDRVTFTPPAALDVTGTTRGRVTWDTPTGPRGETVELVEAVTLQGGPADGARVLVGTWETVHRLTHEAGRAAYVPTDNPTVWTHQESTR